MWCTRWFLPLVILPLPTAPPYFLVVFLISMFLHSRPCFYCMMLLTALFTSSCYWQAVPLNAPLTRPLGNATTFGEAVRANLSVPGTGTGTGTDHSSAITVELPPVVQLLDRCWCNVFSRSGLFEPTDVSAWEQASVERTRKQIEARILAEAEKDKDKDGERREKVNEERAPVEDESGSGKGDERLSSGAGVGGSFSLRGLRDLIFPTTTTTTTPTPISTPSSSNNKYRLKPAATPATPSHPSMSTSPTSSKESESRSPAPLSDLREYREQPHPSDPSALNLDANPEEPHPAMTTEPAKLLRPYYDLRPYGLDIIVDFRWQRQ